MASQGRPGLSRDLRRGFLEGGFGKMLPHPFGEYDHVGVCTTIANLSAPSPSDDLWLVSAIR